MKRSEQQGKEEGNVDKTDGEIYTLDVSFKVLRGASQCFFGITHGAVIFENKS